MARRRAEKWWESALVLGALVYFASRLGKMSPPPPQLSFEQLRTLAQGVGFTGVDADTAAAIALAESGGNVLARGDGGSSFGLWQIHSPAWPQFSVNELLTELGNANAAFFVFSKSGFKAWSTFNSGAYKAHLPKGV